MKILKLILILLIVFSTLSGAEEMPSDQISIDDLSWMAGRWIGEGFGGICEEVWNQPLGGSLTGSFKLAMNNKVGFYELMTISIENGKPALRLKHFNADLTGWEEKDEVISFEFKQLEGHKLTFDGLTYELTQPDTLIITVGIKNSSGESDLTILTCHRE